MSEKDLVARIKENESTKKAIKGNRRTLRYKKNLFLILLKNSTWTELI
jgi:hypothetical protein